MAIAVGAAVWGKGSVPLVVALLVALRSPVLAAGCLAVWVLWSRVLAVDTVTADDEAQFLLEFATELAGGASPRAGLRSVAHATTAVDGDSLVRAIELGLDDSVLADELDRMLPLNGRLAGGAFASVGRSGAPLAPIVGVLAGRAAERGRLIRETRSLTAQARTTAWLIGLLPAAVLAFTIASRGVDAASAPVVIVGFGFQAVGLGVVMAMLWTAR